MNLTWNLVIATFIALFTLVYGKDGIRKYFCPADFIRSGNSCFHFSRMKASWQQAGFMCKDLHRSHLAVLDRRWKERNIRFKLIKRFPDKERWIGGIYNWQQNIWTWESSGKTMRFHAFTERNPKDKSKYQCVMMDNKKLFRWRPRNCYLQKYFICELPLQVNDVHGTRNVYKGEKVIWTKEEKNRQRQEERKHPNETF